MMIDLVKFCTVAAKLRWIHALMTKSTPILKSYPQFVWKNITSLMTIRDGASG